MSQEPMYTVRDNAGAIYGPANIATLQQWIGEGRITAQMQIAPQGTQDFTPAAEMPTLAAAFTAPTALAQIATSTSANPYDQNATNIMQYPAVYPKSSGMATAALVCGIGSYFCAPCAIVAVILGHVARGQIRREPNRYEGQGMATAGLILGYIYIVIATLVLMIYLILVLFFFSAIAAGSR